MPAQLLASFFLFFRSKLNIIPNEIHNRFLAYSITNGCAYRTADASAYTRALADAKSIAVLAADTPTFIAPISNALYPSPLYDACPHGHAWSLRL